MEHLKALDNEQLHIVRKFQEYNIEIGVGIGNRASWYDLVHSNAYSDDLINSKLTSLTHKITSQETLRDNDPDEIVNDNEFYISTSHEQVPITTKEVQIYLRAVKKARRWFSNKREMDLLNEGINKLNLKKMSREERLNSDLNELTRRRDELQNRMVSNVPQTANTTNQRPEPIEQINQDNQIVSVE